MGAHFSSTTFTSPFDDANFSDLSAAETLYPSTSPVAMINFSNSALPRAFAAAVADSLASAPLASPSPLPQPVRNARERAEATTVAAARGRADLFIFWGFLRSADRGDRA